MKITALGQAGVQILLDNGTCIVVDPYLTDTLHEQKGELFARQFPPPQQGFLQEPDILLITHEHGDHLDLATLKPWLDRPERRDICGPYPVYKAITSRWPAKHNAMVMRPGVSVSLAGGVQIDAVPACHETMESVGYLIHAEGKNLYITGDTLYSRQIVDFLQGESIQVAFMCINGFGNNMNAVDAARLAEALQPELVIPVHWDLFRAFGADPQALTANLKSVPSRILRACDEMKL